MAITSTNPSSRLSTGASLLKLVPPLLICALVYSIKVQWPAILNNLGLQPDASSLVEGGRLLSSLVWISFGYLLTCLINLIITQWTARTTVRIPKMLITLFDAVVWIMILFIIVAGVYKESLTALLTTSTVLVGIAGFAMRSLIADFFCGIVLSVERPYELGDWLQVESEDMVGKVVEFNWRSTRIVTSEEITVVVPNSHLVTYPFKNFSKPHSHFRDEIRIPLGFDVTTHQGQRILLSAVNQIEELAGLPVKPSVSIDGYEDRGVIWLLQYWVPDRGRFSSFRFQVHQNILRNLHYARLEIAVPLQDIRLHTMSPADSDAGEGIDELLRHITLFAGLGPAEIARLAEGAGRKIFQANETIMRQGDQGESLFLLNQGLLSVWVQAQDGTPQQVAKIHPGEFFGEMSLLTGAPRAATIMAVTDCLVFEIGKEQISGLLEQRPEFAETLSVALAQRQESNRRFADANSQRVDDDKASTAKRLLNQMRRFFNLATADQS